jgi:hypothetical protein
VVAVLSRLASDADAAMLDRAKPIRPIARL